MTAYVPDLAVIPVVVAPLQALLPIMLAVLVAIGGAILSILKPSTMLSILRFLLRRWIGVLIFLGAVVGCVYGAMYLLETNVAVKDAETGADWSAYRGGPSRRGAVSDSPDPTMKGNVWAFTKDVKTFYSSPAVVGNRVYVCSADVGPFTDKGAIYCLDADTGGIVWKYSPGGFRATYSSPSIAGGYLVSGEGLHLTRDARITCLKAGTGEFLWDYRTQSHVESSPCIADGKAYIGAGDDGLYCIALEPKSDNEPNVLWHLDGSKYPDCETSPIVHEGKLIFGLGEGGHAIVCVDAATGEEVWKKEAPYPVFSSPCVSDGKVFVGMGHGNLVFTAADLRDQKVRELREKGAPAEEIAEAMKMALHGEVWALDPKTGEVEWKYPTDRTILGAIAADGKRLYFGTQGGKFYCLSTDGELVGQPWDARSPICTSASIGSKHVYFITGDGQLYALDNRKLLPQWDMAVATAGRYFFSSPAVGRGHVYVGTEADGLVCVGRAVADTRVPVWAGAFGGPGEGGWSDGSPLPKVGRLAWRYPTKAEEAAATGPAATLRGEIYAPVSDGERTGLAKVTTVAGRRRATVKELWFYPTPNAVPRSAALRPGEVFLVDGAAGQPGRNLHILDAKDGKELWKRPIADAAPGGMLLTESHLFLFDQPGKLTCLKLGAARSKFVTPEVAWSADVSAAVGMPAMGAGELLVASGSTVVALDPADGRPGWKAPLEAPATTGPVAAQDMIAVGTTAGVSVVSRFGHRQVWSRPCGKITSPLVKTDLRLVCSAEKGLHVFDWAGGGIVVRPEAVAGVTPLLVGGTVVYPAAKETSADDAGEPQRWLRLDLAEGQKAEAMNWLRVDEDIYGKVTTGPILVESKLYFGTSKRGLVCGRARK